MKEEISVYLRLHLQQSREAREAYADHIYSATTIREIASWAIDAADQVVIYIYIVMPYHTSLVITNTHYVSMIAYHELCSPNRDYALTILSYLSPIYRQSTIARYFRVLVGTWVSNDE